MDSCYMNHITFPTLLAKAKHLVILHQDSIPRLAQRRVPDQIRKTIHETRRLCYAANVQNRHDYNIHP